jgi:hypothetical protein
MKTKLSITFITILFIASSCTRSLDNPADIAASGTWRVTLFTDSGNNETSDFAGYTFTFNSGGSLTAVKNSVSQTGSWSVNTSSSKFNIDLGPKTDTNKPLGELTDDWKIISTSDTEIKLTDDNVSSSEFLTFSKN